MLLCGLMLLCGRAWRRDLAARNVLIEKGNAEKGVKAVAKIADLGMSIELPDEADVYQVDLPFMSVRE